jgi:hypothetical protein
VTTSPTSNRCQAALRRYDAPIGSYEFCARLLGGTGVMTPGAAFDIERTVRIGFADDTEILCTGLDRSARSSTASPRTDSRQEGERSPAMGQVTARTVTRLQEHGRLR